MGKRCENRRAFFCCGSWLCEIVQIPSREDAEERLVRAKPFDGDVKLERDLRRDVRRPLGHRWCGRSLRDVGQGEHASRQAAATPFRRRLALGTMRRLCRRNHASAEGRLSKPPTITSRA
jgi:hypothetical protein